MNHTHRPKRMNVPKPSRYKTTSSEDEPMAKRCKTSSLPSSLPLASSTPLSSPSSSPLPWSWSLPLSVDDDVEPFRRTLGKQQEHAGQKVDYPNPPSQPLTHSPPSQLSRYPSTAYFAEHSYAHLAPAHPPPATYATPHVCVCGHNQQVLQELTETVKALTEKVKQLESEPEAMDSVERPHFLPLNTVEEVRCFEESPIEDYESAVVYFASLGGQNVKKAVNASFKDAITDACADSFTWFGQGKPPLCTTRIINAIVEATQRSRRFGRPLPKDVEVKLMAAQKAAKERYRQRQIAEGTRQRRRRCVSPRSLAYLRNYWRNGNVVVSSSSNNNDGDAAAQ